MQPTSTPTFRPTSTPTSQPTPTASPTSTPTPPPTPSEPSIEFNDGTHLVPDEVLPGTYRTTIYTADCYWTRLSGFESGLRDLIASRIGSGYQVVTIGPRDAGFDSVGCGTWTNELIPVLPSNTEFGEGTYIVGTDIVPGEYVAGDGMSCSWERLGGFGGARRERIDHGFVSDGEPPQVTIEATDVGFTSSGCGDWRPLFIRLD
jgi:hypothetical protein